jgi:hypothetical protein
MANDADYFKTDDPDVMIKSDKFGVTVVKAVAGLVFSPVWVPIWLLSKILAVKADDMSVDTQSCARVMEDQR